jgi:hypothetical protein
MDKVCPRGIRSRDQVIAAAVTSGLAERDIHAGPAAFAVAPAGLGAENRLISVGFRPRLYAVATAWLTIVPVTLSNSIVSSSGIRLASRIA